MDTATTYSGPVLRCSSFVKQTPPSGALRLASVDGVIVGSFAVDAYVPALELADPASTAAPAVEIGEGASAPISSCSTGSDAFVDAAFASVRSDANVPGGKRGALRTLLGTLLPKWSTPTPDPAPRRHRPF